MSYFFTVFTPTFNRAHTLQRVYGSLVAQTFCDFEWLIVDDGSSDGTGALVAGWMDEARFPIRYQWQPNQGKHVAFNRGVQLAEGEMFLTLDSDDSCLPQALERFHFHWQSIAADRRARFSAVTSLTVDQHGAIVGQRFPAEVFDSNPSELLYRYRVTGEKWGFHRTAVLKEFPFPEVPGLSYLPEIIVWSAISKKYQTRYVNEVLRVYYVAEAGGGALSGQSLVRNARGFAFRDLAILNADMRFARYAPRAFLKRGINVTRFRLLAGLGAVRRQDVPAPFTWLLIAVLSPLGWLLGWMDRRRQAA